MPDVTTMFWDVGGVLLTNGWGKASRRKAAEKFGLDWEDFQDRHELIVTAFETGQLGLEQYLDRTVFYRPRAFSKEEFREFVFSESKEYSETLAVLDRLASRKKYLLATINNESLDLNRHRIERFGLRRYFTIFFSSCFVGVEKPNEAIFRMALQMTQRNCDACVFIDDRELNLECARKCGMRTIHYQSATQLENDLRELGIEV
jgi:putative hydrolase of the HAD superfamily